MLHFRKRIRRETILLIWILIVYHVIVGYVPVWKFLFLQVRRFHSEPTAKITTTRVKMQNKQSHLHHCAQKCLHSASLHSPSARSANLTLHSSKQQISKQVLNLLLSTRLIKTDNRSFMRCLKFVRLVLVKY